MNCPKGHLMFPLREVAPDQHGQSYVIFRCNICDAEAKADYQQYDAERRGSGICPFCGTKFWGQMIMNCRNCGRTIPRVEHDSWSTIQVGSDDIFVPGWRQHFSTDGHFYTPEEWKEKEQTSGNHLAKRASLENSEKPPKRWWRFWE